LALKIYKPTSPGRRGMTGYTFEEITAREPEKSLILPLKKKAGRNAQGKVTVRHRGGGVKQMLRIIDFKRNKTDVPGTVVTIEYDPNRSARIALIKYNDGEKRYILAPLGLQVNDTIVSGINVEMKVGNTLPLGKILAGTIVHNIELQPGKGGQLVRGAGTGAQLVGKEGDFALVRLPSGEMRKIRSECMATIGQIGNTDHQNINLGKAGRRRLMGWRPAVRGCAMSPRDHPHGGGSGRTPVGMPGPRTRWGKPALGVKTRHNKVTDDMIITRRK